MMIGLGNKISKTTHTWYFLLLFEWEESSFISLYLLITIKSIGTPVIYPKKFAACNSLSIYFPMPKNCQSCQNHSDFATFGCYRTYKNENVDHNLTRCDMNICKVKSEHAGLPTYQVWLL